ncbi:hypothetical protein OP256_001305 [Vibrio parahaemolyticus]|nr:hypothetical protein [Vibrio parahaemolyticus]
MSIKYYPLAYYGGNRHSKSDRDFIFKHLECLSEEKQKFVSDVYENIYRSHFNQKKYREARKRANEFLQAYTKENWDVDPRKKETQHLQENRLEEKLNQVKQAAREKNGRKRINLDR